MVGKKQMGAMSKVPCRAAHLTGGETGHAWQLAEIFLSAGQSGSVSPRQGMD